MRWRPMALALVWMASTLASSSALAGATAIPGQVTLSSTTVPAPRGLEARLIDDARDGVLQEVDFASAALLASGVPEDRVPAARERLLSRIDGVRQRAKQTTTAKLRGARILKGLHETVLRRYVEEQSRVDVVIEGGEFNCLSSAVIFAITAEGLVDKPRGMLSQTHAFIRVDVDGRAADVETTTRNGFDVDRKALVTREYLRERGVGDGLSDEERLSDLQHPEEVPTIGLIAALYSNRGVLAVRHGDVDDAALAFDRANRLATGAMKARVGNWRASLLNNAATGLLKEGRALDAQRLLVSSLDGASGTTRATVVTNLTAASVALAEEARAAGRAREALQHVDDALARGGGSPALKGQLQGLRAELLGQLSGGDVRRCEAITIAADRGRCLAAVAQGLLDGGRIDAALDVAREASAASKEPPVVGLHYNILIAAVDATRASRACDRAEALLRELFAVATSLPTRPALDRPRLLARCHQERAVDAVNAARLDDAAVAFARAAAHLPEEPALRQNRAEVELRRADVHARAGRCDEARPLIVRASSLDASSGDRGRRLLEVCANDRAAVAARDRRFGDAVVELRRGLLDAPDSEVLQKNLGDMLHNDAVSHLKASPARCDEARGLLPELRARSLKVAADVERICPG